MICPDCPRPDDWNKHAKCLDSDPEIFYAEADDNENIKKAIRVCMGCEIRGFCLEIGWNDKFGIYGSFTAADRQYLRKAFQLPENPKQKRRVIRTIAHRL